MKSTWFALLVGAVLLFVALPLSATTVPVPLSNECPHEGQAEGCSFLLVLGHGSADLLSDPKVSDVDNQEDILVGINNDSGYYISPDGYKGPNNIFSGINLTGGLIDGGSTYFTVKDWSNSGDGYGDQGDDDSNKMGVTPEPGSLSVLGTGLMFMGGILRRGLLL